MSATTARLYLARSFSPALSVCNPTMTPRFFDPHRAQWSLAKILVAALLLFLVASGVHWMRPPAGATTDAISLMAGFLYLLAATGEQFVMPRTPSIRPGITAFSIVGHGLALATLAVIAWQGPMSYWSLAVPATCTACLWTTAAFSLVADLARLGTSPNSTFLEPPSIWSRVSLASLASALLVLAAIGLTLLTTFSQREHRLSVQRMVHQAPMVNTEAEPRSELP